MVALDKFTVCSHLAPDLAVMLISGDKIEIHTKSNLSDFISGKQIRKMMQSFLTAALTDALKVIFIYIDALFLQSNHPDLG